MASEALSRSQGPEALTREARPETPRWEGEAVALEHREGIRQDGPVPWGPVVAPMLLAPQGPLVSLEWPGSLAHPALPDLPAPQETMSRPAVEEIQEVQGLPDLVGPAMLGGLA